jgi:hypothetical protein
MCSARITAAAKNAFLGIAIVGLLLLSGCKQSEAPKTEGPASGSPKATAEEVRPGTLVEVNGQQYREVDCDCSDEQEKKVDLDSFFDAAFNAPDLKKFVADHMKDVTPLCLTARKKESVLWRSQSKKYDFQFTKFVNYADDKDADLFDDKPPFPATKGPEGKSGPMKADAPSPSKPGKCFVFKGFISVQDKQSGKTLDIDPHIGTGCCK